MIPAYKCALIVGAGNGLSASLARLLATEGLRVGLAARNVDKLSGLAAEVRAVVHPTDASKPDEVETLFAAMDVAIRGSPDVVVYNASARVRGPLFELDPHAVSQAISVTAYGGFLVAQTAARHMLLQFKQRPADSERAGRPEAAAEARRGAHHSDSIAEPTPFPGPLIRNLREGERRAAKGGPTLRYVPLETVELVPREPVWRIPDIQRHEGVECIRDGKESVSEH